MSKIASEFQLYYFVRYYVTGCYGKYKYLGIIVCQKNCDRDLKRQTKYFYANANMLLRRFSMCSITVKCYLFKTYCSNLYCAKIVV